VLQQDSFIYKQLHSCHMGDDMKGSGQWYTEAEAKAYATEMEGCVGFTFDQFHRATPSDKDGVAWFHSKVLESDIRKKHQRKQHLYVIVNRCDDDTRVAVARRRKRHMHVLNEEQQQQQRDMGADTRSAGAACAAAAAEQPRKKPRATVVARRQQQQAVDQQQLICFSAEGELASCDACSQQLKSPGKCNVLLCPNCKHQVCATDRHPPEEKLARSVIAQDLRSADLQWSYEEQLAVLMSKANRGANVSNAPLRTWERCNFRAIYDACGKPRSCVGVWSDPINTVAQSFPECFHADKWRGALEETKPAASNRGTRASSGQESNAMAQLLHAGAACAHLWTAGWMFTLVNKVRLDLFYEGTLSERLYS
jgi:hypothetical protein